MTVRFSPCPLLTHSGAELMLPLPSVLLIHPHIHLPSLVASEASNAFSTLLLPSLLTLDRRGEGGVWVRAEKLFREKVEEIPKSE